LNIFSAEPGTLFTYRQINRRLGVTNKEGREEVSNILKGMKKNGEVLHTQDDAYAFNPDYKGAERTSTRGERTSGRGERSGRREEERRSGGRESSSRRGGPILVGKVDLANGRHAYVISEDSEQDIRVPVEKLKFAMAGDIVRVQLRSSRRPGDRPEGEVVEVLQREREEIVGRLEMSKGYGFLVPDQKRM